mmetsp:Transcript_12996/g.22200  ORF Transcript_12996/g.22200 Transcript_12996/m.22200 type:complete len:113 (+) Transcript_12996:53-391(+)
MSGVDTTPLEECGREQEEVIDLEQKRIDATIKKKAEQGLTEAQKKEKAAREKAKQEEEERAAAAAAKLEKKRKEAEERLKNKPKIEEKPKGDLAAAAEKLKFMVEAKKNAKK